MIHEADRVLSAAAVSQALLWNFDRLLPRVLSVELEQVECVEEHAVIIAAVADLLKDRQAGRVASNSLAVDYEALGAKRVRCFHNERITNPTNHVRFG